LRWYSLMAFYRSRGATERLAREDAPRVFRALDRLVPLMHTPYPEVAVADTAYLLPCTLGARRPVILLPPEMVEESSDEVLEAVLAHELAHIKRRDNIFHWAFVVLRDLLFFNPAAHFVFSKIMLAKEKACDSIAARVIEKPAALGQAIYEAASLAVTRKLAPLPGNLSGLTGPFSRTGNARQRIISLKHPEAEASRTSPISIAILAFWVLIALLLNIFIRAPYPHLLPVIQF
ncbi:MAG: M56 family metallopeptidase, partial [Dehalococcoidia bacterium]|nr:M56 family metallopeptidase [Dehalococcoidia bacterium]